MNLTVLGFLLIFNLFFGKANNNQSDKDNYHLIGPVESVFTARYHASSDSTGIEKGEYFSSRHKEVFESKLMTFYYHSTPNNALCLFDQNGNITTILYFRGKETKLHMAEIRHREKDTILETIYLGDEITFNYNVILSKGLPIRRELKTERNDTLISNYVYKKRKVVEETFFKNSRLGTKIKYDYNSEGDISELIYFHGKNDTSLIFNYDYNDESYKFQEIRKSFSFETITKYKYKYDSIGNWTVCYEYKDDNLVAIVERKIKYYR